jgi:hypothetical protein
MIRTNEERLGKSIIRWKREADGSFSGAVISNGKVGETLQDTEQARLLARLRNHAGTLEPNYFGMEEAISRFLTFMPGGFQGDRNLSEERDYKVRASENLRKVLDVEQAHKATSEQALAVRAASIWINLLSPYESMHLKDAIASPSGAAFLHGAAKFAAGDIAAGAEGMRQAIKAYGPLTWPIATYFPFLWDPSKHMFLKPSVTCDFAERIGQPFQYDYEAEIRPEVYRSLLNLTEQTRQAISELKPRDNIDVQSFIWVVGGYREADLPRQ